MQHEVERGPRELIAKQIGGVVVRAPGVNDDG